VVEVDINSFLAHHEGISRSAV